MRTRCPGCETVFRITPEQLRARQGKVRCGQCQMVFNALETLIEEVPIISGPSAPASAAVAGPEVWPLLERQSEAPPVIEFLATVAVLTGDEAEEGPPAATPVGEVSPAESIFAAADQASSEAADEGCAPVAPAVMDRPAEPVPAAVGVTSEYPGNGPPPRDETPQESTDAARAVGLVAARELADVPGYNRWAAGTLASTPTLGLPNGAPRRTLWPFALVAALLTLGLLSQLAIRYRTEIVQRHGEAEKIFAALGLEVALPSQADLVSIEASDLQSDNGRGLLILQATIKNRADYAQSWPALELTLTDSQDVVVARRVVDPGSYLPSGADPKAFAANSETAVKLWIDARNLGAVGYRLYLFYP